MNFLYEWDDSVSSQELRHLWHQPAELGFGLNVPDTISPRLEEEFPLDLLLQ